MRTGPWTGPCEMKEYPATILGQATLDEVPARRPPNVSALRQAKGNLNQHSKHQQHQRNQQIDATVKSANLRDQPANLSRAVSCGVHVVSARGKSAQRPSRDQIPAVHPGSPPCIPQPATLVDRPSAVSFAADFLRTRIAYRVDA